ncbi:YkgJ family cysteine cluster protein [Vibrio cincinnatiensis]|uniref:YkgJ family cysteine cluster protein n=2 Tax=Vibrio TaxID=662 RepID=UPI0035580123|nr:YkgJ family cysteine cluster protein [Vibrio cincinnatiensis]
MLSNQLKPFPCSSCGLCCRRVNQSMETAFLDRSDGVCRYFDEQTHLCTVYEQRPLVCRVEDYYKENLASSITWDAFIDLNVEICNELQRLSRIQNE